MAGKPKAALILSDAERAQLRAWVRNRKTAQALAQRARIVLECVGADNRTVAAQLSVTPLTVSKWRNRFIRLRLDGLYDAPRSGAPPKIAQARIDAAIIKALEERPANATHWSSRVLAREMDMSQSAISRIWRAFGITPSRHEPFRLSDDPWFAERVRDIAGLYLNPPIRALVLCVAGNSPDQALDSPTQVEFDPHCARRHAAASLFAALDNIFVNDNRQRRKRRRTVFLKFLRIALANMPRQFEFHLVLDHYGSALTQAEQIWLLRHRSCHVYYTPSPASWLNQVKRWHTLLEKKQAEERTPRPTLQLEAAVSEHLERLDTRSPEPFVWNKSRDDIKIVMAHHGIAKL